MSVVLIWNRMLDYIIKMTTSTLIHVIYCITYELYKMPLHNLDDDRDVGPKNYN